MRLRRAIFGIDLTTGCSAGAAILFLSLTGAMLTYERQIVAWQERGYHSVSGTENASAMPIDALVSAASRAWGKSPSSIMIRADPLALPRSIFGREQRVLLDRYTGAMLGSGAVRPRAFFTPVTGLHRWFGWYGPAFRWRSGAAAGHGRLGMTIKTPGFVPQAFHSSCRCAENSSIRDEVLSLTINIFFEVGAMPEDHTCLGP